MNTLLNQRWINLKASLFLVLGVLSGTLLLLEHPTLKATLLLLASIWSFCRLHYFAFCVVEHYVDSSYRFSGLMSFFDYCIRAGNKKD